MEIKLPHRISAILMAALMLLSSTGFSMDIHFCQDNIAGINLFGKAKSCHEKQSTPACHQTKKSCHQEEDGISEADKDNCCHNEAIVIEKSDLDATATQIATLQDIHLDFVAALIAVYVFNYDVQVDYQSYVQYKPPLPDRDVQILYQTFLI